MYQSKLCRNYQKRIDDSRNMTIRELKESESDYKFFYLYFCCIPIWYRTLEFK